MRPVSLPVGGRAGAATLRRSPRRCGRHSDALHRSGTCATEGDDRRPQCRPGRDHIVDDQHPRSTGWHPGFESGRCEPVASGETRLRATGIVPAPEKSPTRHTEAARQRPREQFGLVVAAARDAPRGRRRPSDHIGTCGNDGSEMVGEECDHCASIAVLQAENGCTRDTHELGDRDDTVGDGHRWGDREVRNACRAHDMTDGRTCDTARDEEHGSVLPEGCDTAPVASGGCALQFSSRCPPTDGPNVSCAAWPVSPCSGWG